MERICSTVIYRKGGHSPGVVSPLEGMLKQWFEVVPDRQFEAKSQSSINGQQRSVGFIL